MKYVLLFCLLAESITGHSQFFGGDSKDAIKSALQKNNVKFAELKLTDTTHRISWMDEDKYQVILVMDTNNLVIAQTIIPEKDGVLNGFVKWFNRDYAVISETEWRSYARERIYKIKLSYLMGEPILSVSTIQSND